MNVSLASFSSQGLVRLIIRPAQSTRISVSGSVQMDQHGILRLVPQPSSVAQNAVFYFETEAAFIGGYLFVSNGWGFSAGAKTLIRRQCVIGPGGQLLTSTSSNGSSATQSSFTFASQLYLRQNTQTTPSLQVAQPTAIFVKDLFLDSPVDGGVEFTSPEATMEIGGKFTILGHGNSIALKSGGLPTQTEAKVLSNVTMTLAGNSTLIKTCCIIEYFQFKNTSSPTNPLLTSIQGFYSAALGSSSNHLPLAFDDPLSKADYSSVKSSCSEETQTYGRAPVI